MFWAWVAGLVELIGGVALIVGAFNTPMTVEFRIATLAGLLALSLIGPQAYALDTTVQVLTPIIEVARPSEPVRKAA